MEVIPPEKSNQETTPSLGDLAAAVVREEKESAWEARDAFLRIEIERLIGNLYGKFAGPEAPERFGEEIMAEWYELEMAAETGTDLETAKIRLEAFIAKLEVL